MDEAMEEMMKGLRVAVELWDKATACCRAAVAWWDRIVDEADSAPNPMRMD